MVHKKGLNKAKRGKRLKSEYAKVENVKASFVMPKEKEIKRQATDRKKVSATFITTKGITM